MNYEISCTSCHKPSISLLDFRCPSCGKPLDMKLGFGFEPRQIQRKNHSLWRYSKFLPFVNTEDRITLGEGWTPLVKFNDNVHFKLENLNPTGSFKDRGSTTLISAVHKLVKKLDGYIAEDSSGNAGASIAAYAARAELKAKIYVPQNVSGPKFNQIKSYGMPVVKVAGSRNQVAEKAQQAEKGKFYVGHIFHPLFRDGIRTLAYEIAEQLDWKSPERIYLPVSAGTLLLGVISGFKNLATSGITKTMPTMIACQTRQVSPLYHSVKRLDYKPPKKVTSIADALVSTNPPLLNLMIKELQEAKGDAEIVDENEIEKAFTELAHKGFFVEPSSAVAYSAYRKQLRDKKIPKEDKAVVILTGHGLKTTPQKAP
ncbi:MAG TPA: pyridoxal-phosphate dependent enzyme [Candidatus Bathyarchaeia archaeon]|nr:pyridoxal-phosphate dependent enzyme [Candidatus Bathyarchaeia archaeon]